MPGWTTRDDGAVRGWSAFVFYPLRFVFRSTSSCTATDGAVVAGCPAGQQTEKQAAARPSSAPGNYSNLSRLSRTARRAPGFGIASSPKKYAVRARLRARFFRARASQRALFAQTPNHQSQIPALVTPQARPMSWAFRLIPRIIHATSSALPLTFPFLPLDLNLLLYSCPYHILLVLACVRDRRISGFPDFPFVDAIFSRRGAGQGVGVGGRWRACRKQGSRRAVQARGGLEGARCDRDGAWLRYDGAADLAGRRKLAVHFIKDVDPEDTRLADGERSKDAVQVGD